MLSTVHSAIDCALPHHVRPTWTRRSTDFARGSCAPAGATAHCSREQRHSALPPSLWAGSSRSVLPTGRVSRRHLRRSRIARRQPRAATRPSRRCPRLLTPQPVRAPPRRVRRRRPSTTMGVADRVPVAAAAPAREAAAPDQDRGARDRGARDPAAPARGAAAPRPAAPGRAAAAPGRAAPGRAAAAPGGQEVAADQTAAPAPSCPPYTPRGGKR
jgi:hypothetical protein